MAAAVVMVGILVDNDDAAACLLETTRAVLLVPNSRLLCRQRRGWLAALVSVNWGSGKVRSIDRSGEERGSNGEAHGGEKGC